MGKKLFFLRAIDFEMGLHPVVKDEHFLSSIALSFKRRYVTTLQSKMVGLRLETELGLNLVGPSSFFLRKLIRSRASSAIAVQRSICLDLGRAFGSQKINRTEFEIFKHRNFTVYKGLFVNDVIFFSLITLTPPHPLNK